MINENQRTLIEQLNSMYQSQSLEYRKQYRDEYFSILEYLVQRPDEYIVSISDKTGEFERIKNIQHNETNND